MLLEVGQLRHRGGSLLVVRSFLSFLHLAIFVLRIGASLSAASCPCLQRGVAALCSKRRVLLRTDAFKFWRYFPASVRRDCPIFTGLWFVAVRELAHAKIWRPLRRVSSLVI